jgi:methylated-DNA-[protein]-cysteine S-methyltransferase
MSTAYTFLSSPFGRILVAWSDRGLERVGIGADLEKQADPQWRLDRSLDCDATRQLCEYFGGERRRFDLPLVVEGTPFRVRVWHALERIPFGETVSYGRVGEWIGSPDSSRAVGMACGANPLPIVIPCHRVIGANGKLVGFGGGLAMKQAMLEFERRQAGAAQGRLALAG